MSSEIAAADLQLLVRLIVAAVLAAALGWEREQAHKPAGLRTHMLVGVGSALFVVLVLARPVRRSSVLLGKWLEGRAKRQTTEAIRAAARAFDAPFTTADLYDERGEQLMACSPMPVMAREAPRRRAGRSSSPRTSG